MGPNDIEVRWREADAKLRAIYELRVVPGCDSAHLEGERLECPDELEFAAGELYFNQRDGQQGK